MTRTERIWVALRFGVWVWVAVLGASIAIAPLLSTMYFVVPGALLAAIVVLTGALLRAVPVPWPFVGLAQFLVLVEVVTLIYARDGATLGVLPDRDTAEAIGSMINATIAHSQEYPAPVPRLAALDTTLAAGIGLLAVVVDQLAASRRTVPLVGLVFLTVYMTPVSLLSGHVTMWAFIPGALGYVFLLAAAERRHTADWGHHLTDLGRRATRVDAASRGNGLSSAGRRTGLGAVACAVVVPFFVPTLSPHLFGQRGAGPGGSGSSDVTVANPMLDLRRNLTGQSDAVLVRVTDASDPPTYLRLTALDKLTPKGWAPGKRGPDTEPVDASLPEAPGTAPGVIQSSISAKVTLTDRFHSHWLPVIYAPRTVAVDGPWLVDRSTLDVLAGREGLDGAGVTYSFRAAVPEPSPEQLRNAPNPSKDVRPMLSVPSSLPDSVAERARQVTQGQGSDFDKALALQRWFRSEGGFEYDLSSHSDGSALETIADFVDDDRTGYCEQFSGAMAIMARTLDIPARVAVGFLRPERTGKENFVFRGTDMHAWPELYFEGVGWVRFEPTPGGAGYAPARFSSIDVPEGSSSSSPLHEPQRNRQPKDLRDVPGTAVGGSDNTTGGSGSPWTGIGVGAVVALLVLFIPLAARTAVSRRRWRRSVTDSDLVEAAWAELRSRVRDLGGDWDGDATPRMIGHTLRGRIAADPEALAALSLLVTQTERARYDRDCDPAGLRDAIDLVVGCLASRSTRRRRTVARWLPVAWVSGLVESRRRAREDGTGLIALRE